MLNSGLKRSAIPPFVFDHKLNIMFMRKNWAGNNNFRILFSLWRIQQRRTGTWSTSLKIQTGSSRIFVHHPYLITSWVNWLELNFLGNLNITTPGNQTTISLKCIPYLSKRATVQGMSCFYFGLSHTPVFTLLISAAWQS